MTTPPAPLICDACGQRYWPAQTWIHAKCLVANAPMVANKSNGLVANSRHGKYADADKRRKYMREYMRTRRAG